MRTTVCSFPGCVSLVPDGGVRCVVHRGRQGVRCEHCKGSGAFVGDDRTRIPCDRCGGTGLKDARRRAPRAKKGADPVDHRGLIQRAEDI